MAVLKALRVPASGPITPGQTFPLTGDSIVLGRHPECSIVLEAGAISRQHAQILKSGDDYYLEDLHSRNGTFLNGERVDGRARLSEGDELKVCDLVFTVHLGSADAPGRTRPFAAATEAVVMVDDAGGGDFATIHSKLDVSSASGSLRLTVNPDVKLKALLEIGRNLGGAVRLSEVLAKLLENLFTIFLQADRGFIVLRDRATGRLVPKAFKHRREDAAEQIRISRTILEGVIAGKEAILSADAATDCRFEMSDSIVDFQIRSMMCAPLIGSDGDVLGALQIDARDPRRRFSHDDLDLLASVACQAALAVENAQLHEIAMDEESIRRELALAHKVQQGLLPARPPRLDGYEFFDFYRPAQHLGGDYFDYVPLPGGTLAAALADVSGKGVSAALLMARLSAEVRYCLAMLSDPAAAMERLNALFCESQWEDRFVTMVLAVLDPVRHELTMVNAGHLPPLLRRASGSVTPMGEQSGGLPLGVESTSTYQSCRFSLDPGDALIVYTDGLSDALNPEGQSYGNQRLRAQLGLEGEHAATLSQRLLNDIRRFVGNRPQADDMCLTCVRRLT
jgi:serine phosphatase RsbU (regulator of sigma subunit)